MEPKPRRTILGSLAALLVTPFVLGREGVVRALAPKSEPDDLPRPHITPPAHSVKRRG